MKKLLISIILFFLCSLFSNFYAQDEELLSPSAEIYFLTTTPHNNDPIMTLTFTAQSYVHWSGDFYDFNGDDIPWGIIYPERYPGYYNSSYTPAANNQTDQVDGWNFISTSPVGANLNIGYGLYKVTNNLNSFSFYIDFRDQQYGYYPFGGMACTGAHEIDLWIKYNSNTGAIKFSYINSLSEGSCGWTEIHEEELLTIGEIKYGILNLPTPLTKDFNILGYDFWENCFNVITGFGGHPVLVWVPNQERTTNPEHYYIYRSTDNVSYSKIAEIENNIYSWTDDSKVISNIAGSHFYYKIAAEFSTTDLVYTEPVDAGKCLNSSQQQEKLKSKLTNLKINGFTLSQCYPNPFNPTSQIAFSIPQAAFTQLKVYDMFGREIQTLVNEQLSEGNHSFQFNGKNLASGVYFYTLKAGNYSATKKMILTK